MKILSAAVVGTVTCLSGYHSASAQIVELDCDADGPHLIQGAIGHSYVEIHFTGTCDGFEAHQTNVDIIGSGPDTAAINGLILVDRANVTLRGFAVNGMEVVPGVFEGGVGVVNGSYAVIRDIVIQDGFLAALQNSGAEVRAVTITAPENDNAVQVFRNSFIRFVANNSITSTSVDAPAVTVGSNSSLIVTQDGNTFDAVSRVLSVARGSIAEIWRGEVTGDVTVDLHSVLSTGIGQFGGDLFMNGNVTLSRDSALVFDAPPPEAGTLTFNGTVTCLDTESSLTGMPQGSNTSDCTDFSADPVGPPFGPPGNGKGPKRNR